MGENLCIMRANYLHTSRRVRWVCLLLYSSCFTNVQLTRWSSCCCIYPLLWAGLLGEDLGDGLNCGQSLRTSAPIWPWPGPPAANLLPLVKWLAALANYE